MLKFNLCEKRSQNEILFCRETPCSDGTLTNPFFMIAKQNLSDVIAESCSSRL